MNNELRIAELIINYRNNKLSPEERIELENWISSAPENDRLFRKWTNSDAVTQEYMSSAGAHTEIWRRIKPHLNEKQKSRSARISTFIYWAAAACIVAAISFGIYVWISPQGTGDKRSFSNRYQNDIAPGSEKAILTLADGRRINLQDAANGVIADQNGAKITKEGGVISYQVNGEDLTSLINQINVPKKGFFKVILPDGTAVWLNSDTELIYPAAFNDQKRIVKLKGEAYFEVAHVTRSDKSRVPFIVETANSDIEVLGTHFNIMAYGDEPSTNTTLLEGLVVVRSKNEKVLLNPGQQTQVNNSTNQLGVKPNVDLAKVVAWKNGLFNFDNQDLSFIMRQISRWYNVDIQYKAKTSEKFFGTFDRNMQLSEMLDALETTGLVSFEITGNTIIVMNAKN